MTDSTPSAPKQPTAAEHIAQIAQTVRRTLFEIGTQHPDDIPERHTRIVHARMQKLFSDEKWIADVVAKVLVDPADSMINEICLKPAQANPPAEAPGTGTLPHALLYLRRGGQ